TDRRPSEAFDRVEVLEPALAHAGFVDIEGIEVRESIRFDDLDHVERWLRSHFARQMLEALDPDELATVRARMAAALEANRTPRGYELAQRARITAARR
ncbi:MAG: hypothetical protein KDA94_08710, partial [Acidimicrobiales bacterium]|nr:hypothetical protein [Acidimicrobiales bacterium]